jgi:DNA-binding MarR family transcriptional regulator
LSDHDGTPLSGGDGTTPGDDDPRPFTIMMAFRQTARLMIDELIERLKADGHDGVHPSHHALYENIDADGTRLTELAARAGMSHQAMGELVVSLERGGWVERRPDPTDGRARLVCLTSSGRHLVIRGLHHIAAIEAEWQERWRAAGHDGALRPVLERAVKDAAQTRAGVAA